MANALSDADAEGIEERESFSLPSGRTKAQPSPKAKGQTKAKGLTHKQEKFARHVALGSSQADAYRAAYDTEGMVDKTIINEAHLLASRQDIAQRVDSLKAVVIRTDWQDMVQMRALALETLANEAAGQGPDTKSSARIAAAVAIGKITEVDLFTDHKVVEHVDNRQLANLTTKLEQRLKLLFNKAQLSPINALPRLEQAKEPDPDPSDPT